MWYILAFAFGLLLGGWAVYRVLLSGMEKLMEDRVLVFRRGLDND